MVVLILQKATPGLRGELSRWLIQPQAGVYVGRVSARVRDLLWQKIVSSSAKHTCILLYSSDSEQGFSVRTHGSPKRRVQDFEGFFLVKTQLTP